MVGSVLAVKFVLEDNAFLAALAAGVAGANFVAMLYKL